MAGAADRSAVDPVGGLGRDGSYGIHSGDAGGAFELRGDIDHVHSNGPFFHAGIGKSVPARAEIYGA